MSLPMPDSIKRGPDDYWQSAKFVRRYVTSNINLIRENEPARVFNITCMMGLLQGIQYLCPNPTDVLDAGCGHATRSLDIKAKLGCRVVGVDYSEPMMVESRRIMEMLPAERRVELVKGDVRALEMDRNSFDVVVTYGLFMVMADAPRAATELLRVSRHGLVCIEESDDAMTDMQREETAKQMRAQPGRSYQWNYNRMFAMAGARCVMFTPIPVSEDWSMGGPPGYARYIVVKEQNQDAAA